MPRSCRGCSFIFPCPVCAEDLTIDAMLLARGAAWLALSESMLKTPNTAAEENWAPILFMAGRENAACALWKSKVKFAEKTPTATTLFEWWDFFLRRPKARAAFEFAANPKQQRFAMPMITYYSRLQDLGSALADVMGPLFGEKPELFIRLHNYGGFLAASTSVGGGRILEGAWPAIFRMEWMKTLQEFPSSSLDYKGYADKIKIIPLTAQTEADDSSLMAFEQAVPLLQLGHDQGEGKLIPVATVTARDLLNYGWEMNALQMGARYYFVNSMWGVPDLAETIFQQATRNIEGQTPFFPNKLQAKVFNLQESFYRLQMVDDLGWAHQGGCAAILQGHHRYAYRFHLLQTLLASPL